MGESLAADEFDQWEPWPKAYDRLGKLIGYSEARSEICRRLTLGSMQACAREAFWQYEDRPGFERREFEVLAVPLWTAGGTPGIHANVWTTGSYDFAIKRHYREYITQCQGIRIEPAGVNQVLVDAGVTTGEMGVSGPTSRRRQDLPKLPESIAVAWMAWFKTQPNSSKEAAEKSALHMFPNHNLSRDRIRELFGAASQGRPRKTAD